MALTDELFKSIDTIVSARLANLHYDQTIECEIINADTAAQGIYKVQYQAATFDATSPVTTYEVGDRVYVAIPQNDYDQNKIILNKKYVDETTLAKTLPFLSFAYNPDANLFSAIRTKQVSIPTSNLTSSSIIVGSNTYLNGYLAGYTKLGVKFSLNTNIGNDVASGDYGITLIVTGYDQSTEYYPAQLQGKVNDLQTWEFKLNTDDMIVSNIYNTVGQCNQEKVFDITNKVITGIRLEVWQDGNFTSTSGGGINNQLIYFNNFQVYLGYPLSDFKNSSNKIMIYTLDGLAYTPEYLTKNVKVRALELISDTNNFNEFILDDLDWTYEWKIDELNNIEGEDISLNSASIKLSSSRNQRTKSCFLSLTRNIDNQKIETNKITFVNAAYLANSSLLDIVTGLQITEENDNNIYNIYGQDNYTTDQLATAWEHAFLVSFNSLSQEEKANGLLKGDIITWAIPSNNTMIQEPIFYSSGENGITDSIYSLDTDKQVYICQKTIPNDCEFLRIPYKIKEYYSPKNVNNTIKFTLLRGIEEYKADYELFFGTSGVQGSEYSIIPYLTLNGVRVPHVLFNKNKNENRYQINFDLYDYNNNKIDYSDIKFKFYADLKNKNIKYYDENDGEITDNNFDNISKLFIQLNDNDEDNNEISDITKYYGSIEINVQIGNNKEISNFFPIPIASDNNIKSVNAPSVVTYDVTGKKPFFNKNQLAISIEENTIATDGYKWEISHMDQEKLLLAWPTLDNTTNTLEMPAIYHDKLTNTKILLICKKNDKPIWASPLLIITNKYTTRSENKETNPVPININKDEDNQLYIKNSMVGLVTEPNLLQALSGVFIGTIGTKETSEHDKFGLFGYHDGERVFWLDKDGYVYLEGTEDIAVIINQSNISNSVLGENILITEKLTTPNNQDFNINDNFLLHPDGSLNLTGTLEGVSANFSGPITAPNFNGLASNATTAINYDTSTGNINERMELIKTALNALAEKHLDVTLNLW